MKITDFFPWGKKKPEPVIESKTYKRAAAYLDSGFITPLTTQVLDFDGERNPGSMGPVTYYVPNYYALANRSWQAYMDSPIAGIVINKWIKWIVGSGLKPKAAPAKIVLESEGIFLTKDQTEKFNDQVESRWAVWANSKKSSLSNELNFNELSAEIFKNAKLSGDCLVIIHYVDDTVKIQAVDGSRVRNPNLAKSTSKNWFYSNGVKIDRLTGSVLGYCVYKSDGINFDEVDAYSKSTGLRKAFLVKGTTWKFEYHRALPVIGAVVETMSKLERYRDATIESAEEVAKIAFQVVHQNFSDGSNPMADHLAAAFSGGSDENLPTDELGERLAKTVAVTTGKQAVNNPKGAEIKTLGNAQNISGFNEFHEPNANLICAAAGIPPNIAFSLYTNSYSASRAATKDWDYTMDVERDNFKDQFLIHVWKFWMYTEVAKSKIIVPGYSLALAQGNWMITEAYETVRFTGRHFPHIDPVKEATAERLKLGELARNIPLTSVEQATENLGEGDSDSNMDQFVDELNTFNRLLPTEDITD